MKLAFITDEATQDFMEAVSFATAHGLDGVELRSVGDVPIDRIPAGQIREYHRVLSGNRLAVCNLASSFYKCDRSDRAAVEAEWEKLRRLCELAQLLECPFIRGFSFFSPASTASEASFDVELPAIAEQFARPIEILRGAGLQLLLEADPSVYTTNHQKLARLLGYLDSPQLGAIYDPGNDIYDPDGEIPFPDGYQAAAPYIRHVHIKDALLRNGQPECVKIGTGAVDYPGLLTALASNHYRGYCSLETHYRKNSEISEELLRLPQGNAFSAGGMEATAESAEAFRRLVFRYAASAE